MQIKASDFLQKTEKSVQVITSGSHASEGKEQHAKKQTHDAARMTISQTGRNRLRLLMQEEANAFTALKDSYEAEQTAVEAADIPAARETGDRNREVLNQVKNRFDAIIEARTPENDRESIQDKQRAQADLRRMKQFEQETKQRMEKETREAKANTAKMQAETDKDKGELLVMLESFEEYEKKKSEAEDREDRQENSAAGIGEKPGEAKTVGDVLKNSAAQMMTSEMTKEDIKNRSIDYIDNKGLFMLDKAQEEYEHFMDEYELISRVFDEEDLSEEEKSALVEAYKSKAEGDRYHPGGYSEVEKNHTRGLAYRQNARDVRRESLAVETMPSVQKVSRDMSAAASETVLDGQTQQYVENAADELDERLQKKIDDRNDVTKDMEEMQEEVQEEKEKEQEPEQDTKIHST